jgi:hypothetical protein
LVAVQATTQNNRIIPLVELMTKAPAPTTAEYILKAHNGVVLGLATGYPHPELSKGDIALSKSEFELLRLLSLHQIDYAQASKVLENVLKRLTPKAKSNKRSKKNA